MEWLVIIGPASAAHAAALRCPSKLDVRTHWAVSDGRELWLCGFATHTRWADLYQQPPGRAQVSPVELHVRCQTPNDPVRSRVRKTFSQPPSPPRGAAAMRWDPQQVLLRVTRDRVGQIPLWWTYQPTINRLLVSTHAAWLLWARGEPVLQPCEQWLMEWLANTLHPESAASSVKGLQRIPPGWSLSWQSGLETPKLSRSERDGIVRSWPSFDEAADELRACLLDVVRAPPDKAAVLVSGGMDASSILATWAQHHPGRRLKASTILSKRWSTFDESDGVSLLNQHLELDLQRWFAEQHWNITQTEWVFAEPWHGPLMHPGADLMQQFSGAVCETHGVSWLINGEGGDMLFSAPRDALMRAWMRTRPEWYAGTSAGRTALVQHLRSIVVSSLKRRLPPSVMAWRVLLKRRHMPRSHGPSCHWFQWASYRFLVNYFDIRQELVDEQRFNLHDWSWERGLAMFRSLQAATGCQLWMPLCDERVVMLAKQFPLTFLTRHASTKAILRKAMGPWLPKTFLARPKMGLFDPLMAFLLTHPTTQTLVFDLISDRARLESLGLIEARSLLAAMSRYVSHVDDQGANLLGGLGSLWHFLLAEFWLHALTACKPQHLAAAVQSVHHAS